MIFLIKLLEVFFKDVWKVWQTWREMLLYNIINTFFSDHLQPKKAAQFA